MADVKAEVAVLSDNVATLKENDKEHYTSNDKRKEETNKNSHNIELIGMSIEEQSKGMSGVVELIEHVQESVDRLSKKVDDISLSQTEQKLQTELLRQDFESFKGKNFVLVRIFKWIGAYGDKNPKSFMLCVMFLLVLIWIGVFPESEPFISSVFDKLFDTVKVSK